MFEVIRLVLATFDDNMARGMPRAEAEDILAMDCWTIEQFPIQLPEE